MSHSARWDRSEICSPDLFCSYYVQSTVYQNSQSVKKVPFRATRATTHIKSGRILFIGNFCHIYRDILQLIGTFQYPYTLAFYVDTGNSSLQGFPLGC